MTIVGILALVFAFSSIMSVTRNRERRGRRYQLRFGGSEATADELADIERRLASVEQLENRVLELENRLDFAERLLTSRTGQGSEAP